MTYQKPQIARLANPILSIQGSTDKTGMIQDSHPTEPGYPLTVTTAAYEADE
jgi:hypothetical protein